MNYEQKYKEAIIKLRELFNSAEDNNETLDLWFNDFVNIFPELKESDNERIGKAIIHTLTTSSPLSCDLQEAISWIKSQEQRYDINDICEWLKTHIKLYINSEYNEFHHAFEYDGTVDINGLINDLRSKLQIYDYRRLR